MRGITRRRFLQGGLAAGLAVMLPGPRRIALAAPSSRSLRRYVQPLPLPGAGLIVATPTGPDQYTFTQRQIARQLHPDLPATPIWAYDDGSGLSGQAGSFGMAVVAQSGTPLTIQYTNDLPATYPSWLPVDTRLTPMSDEVRLMTHLHGGFVDAASDGNPAVTPSGFGRGDTQVVHYSNQLPEMPASLLWFHDHGLGTTRLNVFAGLAAAYILRDAFDTGEEPNPLGIPGGPYEIPLVIQDRQFNPDGSFRYPTSDIDGVTWIGEYFGDTMLVNGKVWPFVDVEPRLYRLRVLNGCNARILNLDLGLPLWQIGAEGGMFDVPVLVDRLVLAPAERADVLVDFAAVAGRSLVLRNRRPPRPVTSPAPNLASVLQFRVGTTVTQAGPSVIPAALSGGRRANLASPAATRYITLNEIDVDQPSWYLNVNGLRFGLDATERPALGSIEDWVFVNMTGDTHPMHMHLVTFQVVGRTPFDVEAYEEAYGGPDGVPGGIDPSPFATGPMLPPAPEERGFKDTVKADPGYFTTIRARFDLPSGITTPQTYVYHCHIVEHEDNDMMRPFTVGASA